MKKYEIKINKYIKKDTLNLFLLIKAELLDRKISMENLVMDKTQFVDSNKKITDYKNADLVRIFVKC